MMVSDEGRGRWLRARVQWALLGRGRNPDRPQRLLCLLLGHVPVHDQCRRPGCDYCLWCRLDMPFQADPYPPSNVQAVLADGTHVPLECAYVGVESGNHVWRATAELPSRPVSLHIGLMPAQTAIHLAYHDDGGAGPTRL